MRSGDPIAMLSRIAPGIEALTAAAPGVAALGERFADAGFELAYVGGPVRDALLERPIVDIDLTTNARPNDTLGLLAGWADAVWEVGIRFGTVGARRGDQIFEITTYRADSYDAASRKPEVSFGDSLEDDLARRDFAVNAMAVRVPSMTFVDPFGGITDLAIGLLRTPGDPRASFGDDPLRMLRAARFTSQLGFRIDPAALGAMSSMAARLEVVSAERIREEFSRLLMTPDPLVGLRILTDTGLAEEFLPELPALRLEIDEHHRHKDVYEHSLRVLTQAISLETAHDPTSPPDLILRLAALLHDVGKPATRKHEQGGAVSFHHHEVVGARMVKKRLTALRYSGDVITAVTLLTELHLRFHGYGDATWTDAAVRRYVRDAGEELVRLHKLTRADCTTRNRARAAQLAGAYDSLEQRIALLAEAEELSAIRPDLDGNEIMALLGIGPGRDVGAAYNYLLDLRMEEGPLGPDAAEHRLREWWAQRT